MNEQLIVKNFGPIKDATVDFKRVTVFIGPTGGGKSTLAKLVTILRGQRSMVGASGTSGADEQFAKYHISSYYDDDSILTWKVPNRVNIIIATEDGNSEIPDDFPILNEQHFESLTDKFFTGEHTLINEIISKRPVSVRDEVLKEIREEIKRILINKTKDEITHLFPVYIPTERVFIPAIEYSWAGLMRDDIGLPNLLLEFANSFSLSRKEINELDIPFLQVKYIHSDGRDFIKIPEREELLLLSETASGIQSAIPLLVLLEHISRNTEQARSFIIEEPELNLFPLAQFELVKILVEKCAQTDGKNDLVLTTHSPYVLTALNLLCYAYRIAQQDEATAKKVAKLIPRHCWIDPDQLAAYYVDRPDTKRKQQVRSIINKKTGLIEENELDTASDELGAIFDKLVRLRKPTQMPSRAK